MQAQQIVSARVGPCKSMVTASSRQTRWPACSLVADVNTASSIGRRRGQPIILKIAGANMQSDGLHRIGPGRRLFLSCLSSANRVWLMAQVRPEYSPSRESNKRSCTYDPRFYTPTHLFLSRLIHPASARRWAPPVPHVTPLHG